MWKDAMYNGKKIEGWEINKKGILRNKETKKLKFARDNNKGKDGHQRVSIRHKQYYLHRILAETFIPNKHPDIWRVVRHKDDNPKNNSLKNLTWGSHRDNTLDAIKNKKIVYDEHRRYTRNEDHPMAILKNKDVEKICKKLKKCEKITDIANEFGVDRDVILHIYKGNTWKPISKKYMPFPVQVAHKKLDDNLRKKVDKYVKKHPELKPRKVIEKLGLEYSHKLKAHIEYIRRVNRCSTTIESEGSK